LALGTQRNSSSYRVIRVIKLFHAANITVNIKGFKNKDFATVTAMGNSRATQALLERIWLVGM